MSEIKVLLVEDNPLHVENIEMLLENMELELSGVANNALDALALVQTIQPDLILLDIHISGGFTGIEFAERVRKKSAVPIIYISSAREKEVFEKAKATQPDAFVYKPIIEENLISSIELALNKTNKNEAEGEDVLENVLKDVMFVRIGNSLKKININDIVFVSTMTKNYADIQSKDKSYAIRSSLNNILDMLPESQFIRICRTHVLNLKYIEEIDDKHMEIDTGFGIVPMSKTGKSELYRIIRKA